MGLGAIVLTAAALAQSQTGALHGRIHDSQNQGVAGVQVQLVRKDGSPKQLKQANQPYPSQISQPNAAAARTIIKTVSGVDGLFRFVGLRAGLYSLELSVPGGQSEIVGPLSILEGTVDINIKLSSIKPTSLQEGRSVHVFDRSVSVNRRFGFNSLQQLPSSRRIWSILENQDTSTVTQPLDTAGLETGRPALFGALGASWTENQYSLNGLDVTDPYLPGRPLTDPDYNGLADLTTVTAAKPSSISGSGVNVDLMTIPPDGDVHGLVSAFFSNGALQSNNMDARLVRFGFPGPEQFGHIVDLSGQVSGYLPLKQERFPFFISASTQEMSKKLGAFPAPIDAHVYHVVSEFTPFSRGSKQLTLLYAGQHVFNSREGSDPRIAPTATFRGNDNFHQFQAHWFNLLGESTALELNFGVAHAIVSSGIQPDSLGISTVDLPLLTRTGPASLSLAGTRTRYQTNVVVQTERGGALGSHSLAFGGNLERSNIRNRWDSVGGIEQVLVGGSGSEVIRWNTPTTASQHIKNFALFGRDEWRAASWLAVSGGLRFENSSGANSSSGTKISWNTLEPRVGFVMQLPLAGVILRGNFARYGHLLQGRYLDFGNPAALTGQVFQWNDANANQQVDSSEVGQLLRVFGGRFSAVETNLQRPVTDEITAVLEKQFGQRLVATVRFFRRDDRHLVEIVNTGVPFSSYIPTLVIDPGNDGVPGTADDQRLILFNRQPSAMGNDFFVLTNPSGYRGSFKGFEIEIVKRFSRHWSAMGSFAAMHGTAPTNPGNLVFQNDAGSIISNMAIFAALNADPNTLLFATGRGFFDRGFTGKLSGYYEGPRGLYVSAVARYYDGLPFGRMLFVTGFNQGPFFVRATPRADFGAFRTQFNSTLDLRVAKMFSVGRSKISGMLDVFNLLNLNRNTLEADLTNVTFSQRVPLAIQSPRTFRLGVEWKF